MSSKEKDVQEKKIRRLSELDSNLVQKIKDKYQLIKKNAVLIALELILLKKKYLKLN
jgi:hypothetical protein